jgi:hypothetical protein
MAMVYMLVPLAFLAGGFGRRFAGGVWSDWTGHRSPGTLSKIAYAAIVGTLAGLGALVTTGLSWLVIAFCIILGVNVFVGHVTFGLFGGSAAMGRYGRNNAFFSRRKFARDWLCMWGYGLGSVFIAALLSWWIAHPWFHAIGPVWDAGREHLYHWFPLVAAGLCGAPAYAVSWSMWSHGWLKRVPGISENPLQHAEWLFGGCLGVGALLCIS